MIDLNKTNSRPAGGIRPNNTTPSDIDNRTDDLVTIRLEEVGKQRKAPKPLNNRVTLYNDLGTGVRSFKINQQIETAYQQLRTSVVRYANEQSDGAPQNAKEVHFNLSKMSVLIKYENGTEETFDLQAIIEDEDYAHIKQQYERLEELVNPIWGGPLQSAPIEKGRKSSSKGEPPMQRGNHVVLNSLPKDHASCLALAKTLLGSCVKPELKVQREQEAERKINALGTAIDEQLRTVTANIQREDQAKQALVQEQNGPNPRGDINERMRICSEKHHKLKQLEKQLNDRLGLYVAAAFMPASTEGLTESQKLQMIENAAMAAQNTLHSHINQASEPFRNEGVKTTWPAFLPGFIRGNPKEIPDCKDFCTDVAALIFSSLPVGLARRGVLDFWAKHEIAPKSECIADELIRFAFADGETVSMLEGIDNTGSISTSLNVLKTQTHTIFPKAPRDQEIRIHLNRQDDSELNQKQQKTSPFARNDSTSVPRRPRKTTNPPSKYPQQPVVYSYDSDSDDDIVGSGPTISDLPLRGEDGYISSEEDSI